MNYFKLIVSNLYQDRTSTVLTLFAVLATFLLYGVLTTLMATFYSSLSDTSDERLVTMHRFSMMQSLPLPYQERIAMLDEVEAVTHFTWFGGYVKDRTEQVTVFPVDFPTFWQVFDKYTLSDEQKQAWQQTKNGAIVGQKTADKYGWKVGQTVTVGSEIFPQDTGSNFWPIHIVGIFSATQGNTDENQLFIHYDYFNDSRMYGHYSVSWFTTKVVPGVDVDAISAKIDQMFTNAPQPTKTQTEKAVVQEFISQVGNVGKMIAFILSIAVISMLIVIGSNLSQSFRKRVKGVAVMSSLGFSRPTLFALVVSESVVLVVASAAIGLAIAGFSVAAFTQQISIVMPNMQIEYQPLITGLGWAVLLGLIVSVIPVYKLQSANLVQVLRRG